MAHRGLPQSLVPPLGGGIASRTSEGAVADQGRRDHPRRPVHLGEDRMPRRLRWRARDPGQRTALRAARPDPAGGAPGVIRPRGTFADLPGPFFGGGGPPSPGPAPAGAPEKILHRNLLDPGYDGSIEAYLNRGGYRAAAKALGDLQSPEIIDNVKRYGLGG